MENSFLFKGDQGNQETIKCLVHHDVMLNEQGKPFMSLIVFIRIKERQLIELN